MATPDPTPTQNPDPTQTWITCNHCSQPFIRSKNVRGVVVQLRDPDTSYYVTEDISSVFHRSYFGVTLCKGITSANQATNLGLTRIFCSSCKQPAGWRVLQRSQSHPIVDVGHYLLPVSPPPPPPSPPQLQWFKDRADG